MAPPNRLMIVLRAPQAVILATALALGAGPALAQFGGLFDPPRPPSTVPSRPPAAQPAPGGQLLPPGPPPGRIQGEELAPPGSAPPTSSARPANAPAPAAPSGQRPPPPPRPGTPAANASPPPPPEDVVTQPPVQKIANPSAVFSGLDKITGRITAFDAAIGETVQFGALQVTARACYSRPPTESPLTDGFVEVDEVTLQGEVRRIFTGWMFAASPGLHAVEHPIYDVWLTDCKGGAQSVADAQPAAPPAAPPRPPAQRPAAPQQRPPSPPAPRQNVPGGTLLAPGPLR
jgi:hypothetical protein